MTLTKTDKRVIESFTDQKVDSNRKFETQHGVLDGLWFGGRDIAHWQGGKIYMGSLDSRSKQTVQRYIRKITPKNWLAE